LERRFAASVVDSDHGHAGERFTGGMRWGKRRERRRDEYRCANGAVDRRHRRYSSASLVVAVVGPQVAIAGTCARSDSNSDARASSGSHTDANTGACSDACTDTSACTGTDTAAAGTSACAHTDA
jgi:hypothetical protein